MSVGKVARRGTVEIEETDRLAVQADGRAGIRAYPAHARNVNPVGVALYVGDSTGLPGLGHLA